MAQPAVATPWMSSSWPRWMTPRSTASWSDANGRSWRAATIFWTVTAPIPGSASSSSGVAVFRSTRPVAPPPPPPTRRPGRLGGRRSRLRLADPRHLHLLAVAERLREVDRGRRGLQVGVGCVAAGGRDRIGDP